ncbi:replication initiation protein [Shewanella sp. M16]|uniref:replication initiation protein n=1 Tax=Shewanella sp. M16 TaxID=2830837 RepID=UPI001BAF3D24|nr:replication initiation protein [Shewanella sp. M16]MBS0044650.1 replication initiation protein [Shewanella sp. M16]
MNTNLVKTDRIGQLTSDFFRQAHRLVFSQLSMSPVEHDIFALLLSRLDKEHWSVPEDSNTKPSVLSPHYSFTSNVLCEWLKVDNRSLYNVIKEPAKRLSEKIIGLQEPNKRKFIYRSLFKQVSYEDGILTIVPNDLLMNEYLCLSQGHSQIYNDTFKALETDYAKRLYTALCRFKYGQGKLNPFSLEELHAFFGLLDEKGNLIKKTYARTNSFIERIISPAIREIESKEHRIKFIVDEKTQNLGWSYKKQGRKITHIEFLFYWVDPVLIDAAEKKERAKLGNERNPIDLAKETWAVVESFEANSDGNPSVEELNNLTANISALIQAGYKFEADFMMKFSIAMNEARLRS